MLSKFFQQPLGKYVQALLKEWLNHSQLKTGPNDVIIAPSVWREALKVLFVEPIFLRTDDTSLDISYDLQALPLKSESVSTIVCPNVIEYLTDPFPFMRECHRVLEADGKLHLAFLNSWSLWRVFFAVTKFFSSKEKLGFSSQLRIKECLDLLGFEVIEVKSAGYIIPINDPLFINLQQFFDKLLQKINFPCGAMTMLVAQKKTIPLTPIQQQVLAAKKLESDSVLELGIWVHE